MPLGLGFKGSGAHNLQRARDGGPELIPSESDRFLRVGQHGAEAVDLLPEFDLALAVGFQLVLDRFALILFQVGAVDLLLERVDLAAPDAAFH